MPWIHRDVIPHLLKLVSSFPAVLVTGPRQCGKTALLKRVFPQYTYVTFDDPFQVLKAEGSPREFIQEISSPVILDEIQYVPFLFRYIKMEIDRNRENGKFLLTGSQSFQLGNLGSESLAGRMSILELSTLGASELLTHDPTTTLESLMFKGGFPEIWSNTVDPVDWYPSYISTYLQRDIRSLVQVADLNTYSRFLRATALRTGSLLNYADLARDVGISPNTVKRWISLLVTSGILNLVEGWYSNPSSRLIKAPKAYFNDTGLFCALLGFKSVQMMLDSPLLGSVWETFCHGQLRTWLANRGRWHNNLFYWRTKDGKEVDFLVLDGTDLYAFECKSVELPSEGDTRSLDILSKTHKIKKRVILCRTPDYLEHVNGLEVTLDNGCHLDRIFLAHK